MKYLHTMVRVSDVERSLDFYCNKLGFREVRRMESPQGRFTLFYLAAPGDRDDDAQLELTYNWDPEPYGEARYFGHLAYEVDDIYATCEKLRKGGVTINRPPRDGNMAFVRSPDRQAGSATLTISRCFASTPRAPWAAGACPSATARSNACRASARTPCCRRAAAY